MDCQKGKNKCQSSYTYLSKKSVYWWWEYRNIVVHIIHIISNLAVDNNKKALDLLKSVIKESVGYCKKEHTMYAF